MSPLPPRVHSPRECRLQCVVGKGGVGRSSVAAALALSFAERGFRTLVLEINAHAVADLLSVSPAGNDPERVSQNLWIAQLSTDGARREYGLMVLRFRALYERVFENKTVEYLLSAIPSLGEFMMLGKIWYHATQEVDQNGHRRFDRIILDAPATGHAMSFLSVARAVAQISPPGLMRDAAIKMADFIESDASCLHLVLTPEPLAVTESIEFLADAPKKLKMHLGAIFMNRLVPSRFGADDEPVLERLRALSNATPGLKSYVQAAAQHRAYVQQQQRNINTFAQAVPLPRIEIAELSPSAQGLAWTQNFRAPWADLFHGVHAT